MLDIFKEVVFLPIYVFAGFLGYFEALDSVNINSSRKYPIVLVHGWMTQNPIYYFFKRYLEKRGFRVHVPDLGWQLGDINTLAQRLKSFLDTNRLDDVVLVGASEGGIIGLTFLQKMGGWKKVRKFVSIGTPFRGSYLASLAPFSKAAMQMRVGSKFLEELAADSNYPKKKIVNISAKYDEFVPKWSSYLAGAKHEIIDCVGHVNLQAFYPRVYDLLAQIAEG